MSAPTGPEILKSHFRLVRETLLRKADEAGLAANSSIRGAARELVLSEFFEANLAASVSFVTGEIIDVGGQRSGQLDIIIVPTTVPRFSLGGNNVIALAAGVVGAIEVKSYLTASGPDGESELTKTMTASMATKRLLPGPLQPWPWTAQRITDGSQLKLESIPYSLVAYKGPAKTTMAMHLSEWSSKVGNKFLPNTITVLEADYTLTLNDGWVYVPESAENPKALYVESEPGNSLLDLFDFWMKCIQAWTFNRPHTPLNVYLGRRIQPG